MYTRKNFGISMVLFMIAVFLISACSAPAAIVTVSPTAVASVMPTPTETVEATASATETPAPTMTVEPTETPEPTAIATETPEPTATPKPKPTATPALAADPKAPPVLRLYFRSTRKLAAGYNGNLIKGEKNAEFFALPTDKKSAEKSSPKALVGKYWDKYRKDGYKIGYVVNITLKSGKTIHLNIRRPKDAPPIQHEPMYFSKFVEIYMYDSARLDPDGKAYGSWHLQERFIKKGDAVLITTIKFHAGSRYSEVASIDLTAYTYKGTNYFNKKGEYTGSLSYHIKISKE